jgi:hypothetical protein
VALESPRCLAPGAFDFSAAATSRGVWPPAARVTSPHGARVPSSEPPARAPLDREVVVYIGVPALIVILLLILFFT